MTTLNMRRRTATRTLLACTALLAPTAQAFVAPSTLPFGVSSSSSPQHQQQQYRSLNSPLFVSSVEEVINTPSNRNNNNDESSDQSSSIALESNAATTGMDSQQLAAIETQQTTQTFAVDDISAAMNTAVVGGLALATAYILLHEKVEALLALYEYGLGLQSEVTMLGVSLELLGRLPMDAIRAYEELVPTNPIFWKACTSGVAYGLGDFLSQTLQGKTVKTFDLPRSLRSGAAGFIAHGPLCHYWLLTMETYLDFDGAWWATGLKVTADLTVWSIFLNAAYSTIIGVLAGKNPISVLGDVKQTAWPSLRSAWRFWPFVHTISFSHAVPLDLKLLWVDVMEVVWVTILSKVNNEDKAAAIAAKEEESSTDVLAASATDDFSSITTDSTDKDGNQSLMDAVPPQVAKAWAAAWPLVAMWPVLYVGFQVEQAFGLV